MIEKEPWPVLIITTISKRNDSVNIILLCAVHVRVSVLINNDNKRTNFSK